VGRLEGGRVSGYDKALIYYNKHCVFKRFSAPVKSAPLVTPSIAQGKT